jgi:RNA polymerase-binding transcription factor DksA
MQKEILKRLLIEQEDELSNRLDKIQVDFKSRGISNDLSQKNVDRANYDVLIALRNEAQEKLKLIKKSIARLNQGNFGHCLICNNEINDERLKALPHTSYCRLCAQEKEDKVNFNNLKSTVMSDV